MRSSRSYASFRSGRVLLMTAKSRVCGISVRNQRGIQHQVGFDRFGVFYQELCMKKFVFAIAAIAAVAGASFAATQAMAIPPVRDCGLC